LQAFHKEFIPNKSGLLGGQDTVLYRFKAFKTGKATLPFEYGYSSAHCIFVYCPVTRQLIVCRPGYPAQKNITSRVTVHITITKSLTPVPIITTALIPIFMTTPTPNVREHIPYIATTSVALSPATSPAETGPLLNSSMQAASYMVLSILYRSALLILLWPC
jgi:hypothetical protein